MHETKRYLFDTQGCIVVEDVPDADQTQRLLDGIPRSPSGRIVRELENQRRQWKY